MIHGALDIFSRALRGGERRPGRGVLRESDLRRGIAKQYRSDRVRLTRRTNLRNLWSVWEVHRHIAWSGALRLLRRQRLAAPRALVALGGTLGGGERRFLPTPQGIPDSKTRVISTRLTIGVIRRVPHNFLFLHPTEGEEEILEGELRVPAWIVMIHEVQMTIGMPDLRAQRHRALDLTALLDEVVRRPGGELPVLRELFFRPRIEVGLNNHVGLLPREARVREGGSGSQLLRIVRGPGVGR